MNDILLNLLILAAGWVSGLMLGQHLGNERLRRIVEKICLKKDE